MYPNVNIGMSWKIESSSLHILAYSVCVTSIVVWNEKCNEIVTVPGLSGSCPMDGVSGFVLLHTVLWSVSLSAVIVSLLMDLSATIDHRGPSRARRHDPAAMDMTRHPRHLFLLLCLLSSSLMLLLLAIFCSCLTCNKHDTQSIKLQWQLVKVFIPFFPGIVANVLIFLAIAIWLFYSSLSSWGCGCRVHLYSAVARLPDRLLPA